jgi:HAD superfamily hydrolase (TIGR01509 family)
MNNISNYELIIFDCDGTLADSEMAHNTVLMKQLHAMGLTEYTIEKTMETFMGHAVTDIVEKIETTHDVRFPNNHIHSNQAVFREILPNHIRLDSTTRPLLEKLHMAGQKMAVGSNGTRDNVIETIRAAGMKEFFPDEFIFTFEDVKYPKPAPDLYLHVCDAMHTKPADAIVIEDTVAGAMAGIAANIDTVGYVGLSHRDNQVERLQAIDCKWVIESMDELESILFSNCMSSKTA